VAPGVRRVAIVLGVVTLALAVALAFAVAERVVDAPQTGDTLQTGDILQALLRGAPPTASLGDCARAWNAPDNDARRERVARLGLRRARVGFASQPAPLVTGGSPPGTPRHGCSFLVHDGRTYFGVLAWWDEEERVFRWYGQQGAWEVPRTVSGTNATVTEDGRVVVHED
jgi:hypothetical protein